VYIRTVNESVHSCFVTVHIIVCAQTFWRRWLWSVVCEITFCKITLYSVKCWYFSVIDVYACKLAWRQFDRSFCLFMDELRINNNCLWCSRLGSCQLVCQLLVLLWLALLYQAPFAVRTAPAPRRSALPAAYSSWSCPTLLAASVSVYATVALPP
jgi:hypothetical protein